MRRGGLTDEMACFAREGANARRTLCVEGAGAGQNEEERSIAVESITLFYLQLPISSLRFPIPDSCSESAPPLGLPDAQRPPRVSSPRREASSPGQPPRRPASCLRKPSPTRSVHPAPAHPDAKRPSHGTWQTLHRFAYHIDNSGFTDAEAQDDYDDPSGGLVARRWRIGMSALWAALCI